MTCETTLAGMHTIETPFGPPGFLVLAGSRMHGVATEDSDYDYLGAVIESEAHVIGLKSYEQTTFKELSYEGTVYSLRKLVKLIADGNPTVLCLPFAVPITDVHGICTEEFRSMIVSRKAGKKFLGYMTAQRKSMIGERSQSDQRKALIEKYGYDTKFAGHMIRLGWQGIEYLSTGNINVPMKESRRDVVLAVRNGEFKLDDVLNYADALEVELEHSLETTTLPEEPQWDALNEWLRVRYWNTWALRRFGGPVEVDWRG